MRATDPDRTWLGPSGLPIRPYHGLRPSDAAPVVPLEMTRYDIEVNPVFSTFMIGHRLRVEVLTGDAPRIVPPVRALAQLTGGLYEVAHNATAASSLELPLISPRR